VGANDVRTLQDQRSLRGQRPVQSLIDWSILAVTGQRPPDEGFSGCTGHQWVSNLLQVGKMPEQGIVFLESLPESKPGIERQVIALDSG